MLMQCCSKYICNGCDYANQKREREGGLEHRCPYCRNPRPTSQEEIEKRKMNRIKKNDAVAITEMGKQYDKEGDHGKSLEYHTKAAELGNVAAHFCLGCLYYNGVYHFEQAAIGGHPQARGILALHEKIKCRRDRAAKHFIIAANLGCDLSMQEVKDLFVAGIVSKEEYRC